MALSDCPKCWDTPCTCGYQYRNYGGPMLEEQVFSMFEYVPITKALEVIEKVKIKLIERQKKELNKS